MKKIISFLIISLFIFSIPVESFGQTKKLERPNKGTDSNKDLRGGGRPKPKDTNISNEGGYYYFRDDGFEIVLIYENDNDVLLSSLQKKAIAQWVENVGENPSVVYNIISTAPNFMGTEDYISEKCFARGNIVKNFMESLGIPESNLNVFIDMYLVDELFPQPNITLSKPGILITIE